MTGVFWRPLSFVPKTGASLASPWTSEQGRNRVAGAGRTQKALITLGAAAPQGRSCRHPHLTDRVRGPERRGNLPKFTQHMGIVPGL